VIIGIIAAFATPGYLGAKQRAEQRQAATQVRLIYTAEKVRFLESDRYALCTGYVSCNNALNLDLPDDGWAYKVTTSSSKLNFKVSASKGGCTYSMTESSTKPTASAGCVYIP
jgi:type II secretory pathway pseudopilin PulG